MTKATQNNIPVKPQTLEVLDGREDPREAKFIKNLSIYTDPKKAALEAGYSLSYANVVVSTKLKNPKFISKLKEQYNGKATALLPAIMRAEQKAVSYVIDNPEDLPKFRHTLKEIKQTAGVLAADITAQSPTVNISGVQNLMLQIQQQKDSNAE